MKTKSRIMTGMLLVALLLSACNMPAPEATTPTVAVEELVATSAAQTVEALTTQLAQQQPSATQAPTNTQAPTATQATVQATSTIPSIILATATSAVPPAATVCDKAQFVADVTVPDGTTFKAGETFTKTWRLKNVGTCTWSTSYKIVFKSGNSMEGPASANLASSVAPGGTIDISVTLKAPGTNGDYTGNYLLMNASGVEFGLGATAKEVFYVKIKVGSGTAASVTPGGPTVTPGAATATPGTLAISGFSWPSQTTSFTGACPINVTVRAAVRTNRSGTIYYNWVLDSVRQEPELSRVYDSAEAHELTYTVALGAGTHTIAFYSRTNGHTWPALQVTITCE